MEEKFALWRKGWSRRYSQKKVNYFFDVIVHAERLSLEQMELAVSFLYIHHIMAYKAGLISSRPLQLIMEKTLLCDEKVEATGK